MQPDLSAGALDKSGSFTANAIYAPQNVAKLEAVFKEELEKALIDGFTAEEVKTAKSGWLQSRQVSRAQDNELAKIKFRSIYLPPRFCENLRVTFHTTGDLTLFKLTNQSRGGYMRLKFICSLIAVLSLSLPTGPALFARDAEDAEKQASKASKVFQEIMAAPDKAIPTSVLDKSVCIAVFPQVLKAGFIVGGRGGRGVASCRVAGGWSDPAYFDLKGGSFGLQIGAQATDFVLLFMSDDGMKSLLKSKFEMGGDASVAAGPVGREAGASTDLKLDAQILSYSRSKGLFAGLELKGAVISLDESDMKAAYGAGVKAEDVLTGKKAGPAIVKAYPTTLGRYSNRRK